MKKLMLLLGIMAVGVPIAQADIIVPPGRIRPRPPEPRTEPSVSQQTLTGTLGWKTVKRADGTEQKTMLQLTTAEHKVIDLVAAPALENPGVYDKYIGKKVEVKVTLQPVANPQGRTTPVVKSIQSIKETPPARS